MIIIDLEKKPDNTKIVRGFGFAGRAYFACSGLLSGENYVHLAIVLNTIEFVLAFAMEVEVF